MQFISYWAFLNDCDYDDYGDDDDNGVMCAWEKANAMTKEWTWLHKCVIRVSILAVRTVEHSMVVPSGSCFSLEGASDRGKW